MAENKILDKYLAMFGEFPPLLMTLNYDSEIYKKAMQNAIDRGVALDVDDIDEISDQIEYDVELPDEELSAYEIAKRYGKK